jgi:hypothetical protein
MPKLPIPVLPTAEKGQNGLNYKQLQCTGVSRELLRPP